MVVYEDADGPAALRRKRGFRREPVLHKAPFDLAAGRNVLQRDAIVGFGIENNSRHGSLGCFARSQLSPHFGGVLVGVKANKKMQSVVRQTNDGVDAVAP